MTGRKFLCDWRNDAGSKHGTETRLFVNAPDWGDWGTCPGHAEEMLNAARRLFEGAKLSVWKPHMVERWGPVEVSVEDAVLAPEAGQS